MKMKYLLVLIVTIGVAVALDDQNSPLPAVPVQPLPIHHPRRLFPPGPINSNAGNTNTPFGIGPLGGLFSGNIFAPASSIPSSNSYDDNVKQLQTACGSRFFREGPNGVQITNNNVSPACVTALKRIALQMSSNEAALPTGGVSSGNQRNTGRSISTGQQQSKRKNRRNRGRGRKSRISAGTNGNAGSTAVAGSGSGTSDTGFNGVGASASA